MRISIFAIIFSIINIIINIIYRNDQKTFQKSHELYLELLFYLNEVQITFNKFNIINFKLYC